MASYKYGSCIFLLSFILTLLRIDSCVGKMQGKPLLEVHLLPRAGLVSGYGNKNENEMTVKRFRALEQRHSINYEVLLDGKVWLKSGDTCLNVKGKFYCAADGGLRIANGPIVSNGVDSLGKYKKTLVSWKVGQDDKNKSNQPILETSYKQYDRGDVILFEQHYPYGAEGTALPGNPRHTRNSVLSSFPSFSTKCNEVDENENNSCERGFLHYFGPMSGSYGGAGHWGTRTIEGDKIDAAATYGGGASGSGPFVLFNTQASTVISVANNFMSSSYRYDDKKQEIRFGVWGSVTSIPKGYTMSTILTSNGKLQRLEGIRKALKHWGNLLHQVYPNTKESKKSMAEDDFTTKYLAYSTDNGAWYYYQTEPNTNYEDTMVKIKKDAEKLDIPYRHWLMDSWWYYKGQTGGLKNWTARNDIFPNGATSLNEKLQWPVVAHNRWFDVDTVYAKQNGGDFDFLIQERSPSPQPLSGGVGLPLNEDFWDFLFSTSLKWGLYTYEQDWLHNVIEGMIYTMQNATAGRTWLMQMGRSAERYGLKVQYCMSLPRHIMQAVEIPAVTQARASDDYHPGNDQWRPLGLTGMFLDALFMVPTKDNFWSSTEVQTGHSHYKKKQLVEPASRLQSVVSTLSRGPVAPSDRIGFANKQLIMKSCAADGKLLRADFPAAMIDLVIFNRAKLKKQEHIVNEKQSQNSQVVGEVWATAVDLGHTGELIYKTILSVTSSALSISPEFLGLPNGVSYVAWESNATSDFHSLSNERELVIPESRSKLDFQFWHFAPVMPNQWIILGESDTKWIPFSNDRFSGLEVTDQSARFFINGPEGENVHLNFLNPERRLIQLSCRIPSCGSIQISIPDPIC